NRQPPSFLSKAEQAMWDALAAGPQPLAQLLRSTSGLRILNLLVSRGLVVVAGMTPSDAMHVLGKQQDWNAEAARLGATLLIREERNYGRRTEVIDELRFCGEIQE